MEIIRELIWGKLYVYFEMLTVIESKFTMLQSFRSHHYYFLTLCEFGLSDLILIFKKLNTISHVFLNLAVIRVKIVKKIRLGLIIILLFSLIILVSSKSLKILFASKIWVSIAPNIFIFFCIFKVFPVIIFALCLNNKLFLSWWNIWIDVLILELLYKRCKIIECILVDV